MLAVFTALAIVLAIGTLVAIFFVLFIIVDTITGGFEK
jgi:hypothetical protein